MNGIHADGQTPAAFSSNASADFVSRRFQSCSLAPSPFTYAVSPRSRAIARCLSQILAKHSTMPLLVSAPLASPRCGLMLAARRWTARQCLATTGCMTTGRKRRRQQLHRTSNSGRRRTALIALPRANTVRYSQSLQSLWQLRTYM